MIALCRRLLDRLLAAPPAPSTNELMRQVLAREPLRPPRLLQEGKAAVEE